MIKPAFFFLRFFVAITAALFLCACRNESNPLDVAQEPAARGAKISEAALDDIDRPNRMAKESRRPFAPPPQPVTGEDAGFIEVKLVKKSATIKSEPPLGPVRRTKTRLVDFQSAPFPFRGISPQTGRPFLDVIEDGRLGHRTSSGAVYWEDKTYNDSRTLLHIPRGFDVRRPSLMVVFLHGHGATLQRDVIDRQRVPEQVSESGINAVLVAPQLASDAADSSAGKLWEPGAFGRFLDEASAELTKLHGDPRSKTAFDTMPIIIVAYSGGYMTAAACIKHGGAGERVRGVVLLDALYGDLDTFASWISSRQKAFFLSAYANSTRSYNAELTEMLKARDVAFKTKLQGPLRVGSVTFISTDPETEHRDFVTQAWTRHPVKDLLQRLRAEAR